MKLTKGNQSVEKAIRIIELLASSGECMRLSDIAAGVELPSSTVLRMLNTLVETGYAYQEIGLAKRYGLTMKFTSIGQAVADHVSYHDFVHPFLLELAAETNETCCAAMLHENQVQYFDVIVGKTRGSLSVRQKIGGFAYMHCTGAGKMFLTQFSDEQLDNLIRTVGLLPMTAKTITNKETLKRELDVCRARGWALDDEEAELGVRCLSAPIYNPFGKIIITISLSGFISRMTKERCENEYIPRLCAMTHRITCAINGTQSI